VANTLGHTIAVINVKEDANTLAKTMSVGGFGYGCQSGWALGHRLGAREQ
jgi:hypothetical protein